MKSLSRLEKTSLLVVIATLLLGLALPYTRPFHLAALSQVVPTADKNVWAGQADSAIRGPKKTAQILQEHPRDYLLRLGNAIVARDEDQDKAFDALLRDFPQEPSAYAVAMTAPIYRRVNAPNRVEEWGMTPATAAREYKKVQAAPWHKADRNLQRDAQAVRRLLSLLDTAVRLDPDDGFFIYRRAICLFALHRDKEALQAVHQAAIAPRFSSYRDVAERAVDHLWNMRGGFSPLGRANSKFAILGLESKDRSVARIVRHFAFMKISSGDIDGGVSLAMDLMRVGHRIAVTGPDTMTSLCGIAQFAIGAAALDPLSGKIESTDRNKARQLSDKELRFKRELAFLKSHSYLREYALVKTWRNDCDKISNAIHDYLNSSGPGSVTEFLETSGLYVQSFHNASRLLGMSLLALSIWLLIFLLSFRKPFDGLWDRRAALTATLFAALPTALFCELIIEGTVDPTRSIGAMMGAVLETVSPNNGFARMFGVGSFHSAALHWSLITVVVGSLIFGMILARRRTPEPGKRAAIPAALLIPAYAAVLGLVIKDAYNSYLSSYDTMGGVDWKYLVAPLVLLVIYSFFRAINCRFSQVRESGPRTFLATLRHGAALVAAVFAMMYLILLPVTIITGYRTDALARSIGKHEASALRSALR